MTSPFKDRSPSPVQFNDDEPLDYTDDHYDDRINILDPGLEKSLIRHDLDRFRNST